MTDQERCDAIDELNETVANLSAGLEANGKPPKPPKQPETEK